MSDVIALITQISYVINIVIGFFVVFFEKRNPSVTWAWLMVIALVPYVGFILYLMIGYEGRKHTTFKKKAQADEAILKDIGRFWKPIDKEEAISRFRCNDAYAGREHMNDLVLLNYAVGSHGLTTNNGVTMYHEGSSKYESLLKDIKNAKHFIHMQYYIMKNGELGQAVLKALSEKARQGVEVKLFVDGMGSLSLSKHFFDPLIEAGGEVVVFLAPVLIRLNYHNHRKICVIDGSVGYTGGLNIGDEYIGKKKRVGFWRDTHIRITGNAVKDLEARFICDWNYCAKKRITEYAGYFPSLPDSVHGIPIQVVSSGPDTRWPSIQYSYTKMIAEAEKSIYIETPYFVPDESLLEALRSAALSGVDVRIVIPANPDHILVYWASLSYMGDLLDAGVRCYQYINGFIHSKILMMDGLATSVGTANMDIRSLRLNFEINSVIYDADITNAFEHQFMRDLELSTEITREVYAKRSRLTMFKESVARLTSPLL